MVSEEEGRRSQRHSRLTIEFPPTQNAENGAFLTEETWRKLSILPKLVAAKERAGKGSPVEQLTPKRKGTAARGGDGQWLPEGDVTYQPFSHPVADAARRSSRTTASDSSNLPSEPSPLRPSPEADGSNNGGGGNSRASQPAETRRERSAAVGSSGAASHISNEPRLGRTPRRAERLEDISGAAALLEDAQGPTASAQPGTSKGTQPAPAAAQPAQSPILPVWSKEAARSGGPLQGTSHGEKVASGEGGRLAKAGRSVSDSGEHSFLHKPPKMRDKAELGNIDRAPGKHRIEALPPPVAGKRKSRQAGSSGPAKRSRGAAGQSSRGRGRAGRALPAHADSLAGQRKGTSPVPETDAGEEDELGDMLLAELEAAGTEPPAEVIQPQAEPPEPPGGLNQAEQAAGDADGMAGAEVGGSQPPPKRPRSKRSASKQAKYTVKDLLNPSSPVYDPGIEAAVRGLQRHPGSLLWKDTLLSSMTKQQHAWYVRNAGKDLSGQQLANITELQAAVAEEQAVFMAVAKRLGETNLKDRLLHCPAKAQVQFEADAKIKRRRVQEYPQAYRIHSHLHLDKAKPQQGPLHLRHCTALQADRPTLSFRPLSKGSKLDLDQRFLPATSTGASDATGAADVFHKTGEPKVSQDGRVTNGLSSGHASIAAPACALGAMAGLAVDGFGDAWEIPVLVRAHPDSGAQQVVVEKPLLNRKSSLREKTTRLLKWALLSHCTRPGEGRPAEGATTGASASTPRPARLDVMLLGRHRLLVRSHVAAAASNPPSPGASAAVGDSAVAAQGAETTAGGQPVVVRAKAEYHSPTDDRGELITDAELAEWWLAAQFRPGAFVWVGRVHAAKHILMRAEMLHPERLQQQAEAKGIPQRLAVALSLVLDHLADLKPGHYLMTHARGASHITFYQSCSPPATQASMKPLPLSTTATVDVAAIYDLWATHASSGAVDIDNLEYVPLSWVPPEKGTLQIPYTFKPRVNVLGSYRGRQRSMLPTFITRGYGNDWDEIKNAAPETPGPNVEALYEDL